MRTRHIILLLSIATISFLNSFAGSLKSGSVYRFKNYNTGSIMTVNGSGNGAQVLARDDKDLKQQWYVTEKADGTGYYFRNVSTGGYLCSSKATSEQWPVKNTTTLDDDVMLLTVEPYQSTYETTEPLYNIHALSHTGTYIYAHHQANGNMLVCWTRNGSASSYWYIEEVPKTQEQIDEMLKRFENKTDELSKNDIYASHLRSLYDDFSCTRLKTDIGDLESNEDFLALPVGLKEMVRKSAKGNWSETLQGVWDAGDDDSDHWNDHYARKYRVQYYEPYSDGSTAASMAGIQAYTNMNNPTGILGNADDLIYVMVEDPIPSGASLYIGGCPDDQMYNSYTSGTPLHQGLNTILCTTDNSHFFIYYTVATTSAQMQNGRSRYLPVEGRELKNYKPIKIHIEGGRLNGFFNYVGDDESVAASDPEFHYTGDKDADYRYTVARASHVMYDLLGKYIILHLHLNDTPSKPTDSTLQKGVRTSLDPALNPGARFHYDPAEILPYWDNMCFAERILMGIQSDEEIADETNLDMYSTIVGDVSPLEGYVTDPGFHYSDYFNNRMMGISQQGDLFMNATSWRSAYNVSTISAILTLFPEGDIWGPAHEYGHINQGPMNIAGTTEESNNIFSNVALFYAPKGTTSRCDYPVNQLNHFLNGDTFLLNQTWGTTRMFWQLWCYYHATKHNTKFYPRLYELLRRYPITKTTVAGGTHNPKNDMLHFAKMCCIAAGEDLTNFFAAWGFFFPFEMDIDDYSMYHAVLTQADIDQVKEEIKSFGFKVNNAIITIDDRVDNSRASHSEFDKTKCGDVGGLQSFVDNATPSGDYGFTVESNTVTIKKGEDATEGVGFLIFDNEGNLIAFSNSYTFDVTPEIAQQLLDGTLTVEAVGADGISNVEVVNTIRDGSLTEKIENIRNMSAMLNDIESMIDETGTKVGYYYSKPCEEVININRRVEEILEALEENPEAYTSDYLTQVYFDMTNAYYSLTDRADARIPVKDGYTYMITNKAYPTRLLTYSATVQNNAIRTVASSTTFDSTKIPEYSRQWILEKAPGAENAYYVRNVENDMYLGYVSAYNTELPMTDSPQQTFTLIEKNQGEFALSADGNTGSCVHHAAGGAIVRWSDSDASLWHITSVKDKDFMESRRDLLTLMQEAQNRLNQAGEITPVEAYQVDFESQENDMTLNTSESTIYTNNLPSVKDSDGYIFTSWNCLFDNDPSSYFFSKHNGDGTVDGYYPYLRFKAPGEDETFRHVSFSYTTTTRTNLVNSAIDKNPKRFIIEASTDGTTWTTVFTENAAPTGQGTVYATPEFDVPKGTKFIRFALIQNQGGYYYTRNGIQQHVLVVGDVSIMNRTDDVVCSPYSKLYPNVLPVHMQNVYKALMDSEGKYNSPESTIEDLRNQLELSDDADDNLAYHHMILGARMVDVSTDVKEIFIDSATSDAQSVYYNMQGIRVPQPGPGIYIRVRGNKVDKVRLM